MAAIDKEARRALHTHHTARIGDGVVVVSANTVAVVARGGNVASVCYRIAILNREAAIDNGGWRSDEKISGVRLRQIHQAKQRRSCQQGMRLKPLGRRAIVLLRCAMTAKIGAVDKLNIHKAIKKMVRKTSQRTQIRPRQSGLKLTHKAGN